VNVPIHAMGDHWLPGGDQRTALGKLIARAKDDREPEAITELVGLIGEWVVTLALPDETVVTAVAPNPEREDHLAKALAGAVAAALRSPLELDLVLRRYSTPRLRDAEPDERPTITEAAGYSVDPAVRGRAVVLVDDVVLTGTTINHIAGLLDAKGAGEVVGLAASRTRRHPQH